MSKAFTKDSGAGKAEDDKTEDLLSGQKNYMTSQGLAALREEYRKLLHEERPKIVEVVSWAAGNGDRSENGDYIYGKKRLREIDRRVRYLTKRIDSAIVVDPEKQKALQQVFFGATVTYAHKNGAEQTVKIVGVDEADLTTGKISWLSPVARALMKTRVGDTVTLQTPSGRSSVEIIGIRYHA